MSKSILDLAQEHLVARTKKGKKKRLVGTGNFKKKVHSISLAVLPDQIPEAMELDKKLGVSVEYDKTGCPVFDNSVHFRRFSKAHGFRHLGY